MFSLAQKFLLLPGTLTLSLLLFLLVWPFAPLAADTIFLKNGEKIEGQIIGISKDAYRIRTATGVQEFKKRMSAVWV